MQFTDFPVVVEEPVLNSFPQGGGADDTSAKDLAPTCAKSVGEPFLQGLQGTGPRQDSDSQCHSGSRFFPRTGFNSVLLIK